MKIYLLISALAFYFGIWLIAQLHKNEIKKITSEGGIKFEGVFIKVDRLTESFKIAGVSIIIIAPVFIAFLYPLPLLITILLITTFLLSFLVNYFMHVPWGFSFNYDFILGGAAEIANLKNYLLLGLKGINGIFRCPYRNILYTKRIDELTFQLEFRKWPHFLYRLFHADKVILQFKSSEDTNTFEKILKNLLKNSYSKIKITRSTI